MYERLSAILPKRFVEWIQQQLNYMDIHIEGKAFAGFVFFLTLGVSTAIALNFYLFFKIPFIPLFIISFCLFGGLILYWLWFVSESRARFVERILPDALQLIASNIKAGLTTEKALFASARTEFGPLEKELRMASRRIYAGESTIKVLLDIPKKIKSELFEKTMSLLVEGIKAGGQMSELLILLSDDIREENAARAEIKANVTIYVFMIFLTAAIGAPLLFGISSFIVGELQTQIGKLTFPTELIEKAHTTATIKGISFLLTPKEKVGTIISEEFVLLFAVLALIVTSIFASLTIGVIQTGKEKHGIKYIPFLMVISIALFYVTRYLLQGIISSSLQIA